MAVRDIVQAAAGVGGANIEYVGGYIAGVAAGTTNRTITLTSLSGGLASSPSADDLVVVYFGVGDDQDLALGPITGYTQVAEIYANDTCDANLLVAYKYLTGADTSFVIEGGTRGQVGIVVVQVWRGVDGTNPLDVTSTTAGASNTILAVPPAITPVTSGSIIVSGATGAYTAGITPGAQTYSSSDLSGFLTAGNVGTQQATTIGVGYYEWVSGTFTPAQFTWSAGNSSAYSWLGVSMALRPA